MDDSSDSDERAELRTIAFRLREIQRLIGLRVEQENRRLEADGLDPVSRPAILDEKDVASTDDADRP